VIRTAIPPRFATRMVLTFVSQPRTSRRRGQGAGACDLPPGTPGAHRSSIAASRTATSRRLTRAPRRRRPSTRNAGSSGARSRPGGDLPCLVARTSSSTIF
jgi:hypothetical protein